MSHGGNFQDFFFRPDKFLKEHKSEAAIAAAIAASIATYGAFDAYGAAGAGALGAAEGGAGAAAAAGSGLTAADYAALGLGAEAGAGAGAAGAGLTAADYGSAGGLLGSGATDLGAATGYEGGAMGGQGLLGPGVTDAMTIGAAPATNPLDAWGGVDPHAMETGTPDFNTFGAQTDLAAAKIKGYLTGDNVYKGLKALNAANQFSRLAQGPAPPHAAATRPPAYQGGGNELAALQARFANPAGQERLKQLLRQRGIQV